MSVLTSPQETDALLAHFAINPVSDHPAGGLVCGVEGFQNAAKRKALAIVIAASRLIRECPISQSEAQSMLAELVEGGALSKDASFGNLVKHVIVAFSNMYVESGIDAFHFASVHLHPTSYEVGKGQVWRTQPLHIKPRRKHNEPVFHSSFPHVPGRRR
jgi:hypothetical protein